MAMSGKWRINVDTTTLANGDSIAAYLVSAAGTLLTNTTVGAKQALDVYPSSTFAEDAAHTSGDLGQFVLAVRNDTEGALAGTSGDYAPLQVDALGRLRVNADLNVSNDFVYAEDAAATSGDLGASILGVRRDAQASTVSATGDYSELQLWSEGSLKTVDICNGSLLQQEVSVSNLSATALPTTALANRKRLLVQNVDSASVWIGSSTVTSSGAAGGVEVPKGGHIELEAGPAVTVYAISSGAARAVRLLESA